MKYKIFYLSVVVLITTLLTSCEDSIEPQNAPYITFEATSLPISVNLGSEQSKDIKVYAGNVTGSDRVVNVMVVDAATDLDAAALTVPATVTIPQGTNEGVLSINIKDIGLDFTQTRTLTLSLEATDDTFVGEQLVIDVARVCPNDQTELDIVFDGYASETTVDIKDASGNVVFSAGGSWADGLATYMSEICLVPGTYTFTINDTFGDGLSFPSDGSATITYQGNVLYTVSGNFGGSASGTFTIQ